MLALLDPGMTAESSGTSCPRISTVKRPFSSATGKAKQKDDGILHVAHPMRLGQLPTKRGGQEYLHWGNSSEEGTNVAVDTDPLQ